MSNPTTVVHYARESGAAACGWQNPRAVTFRVSMTTCPECLNILLKEAQEKEREGKLP